MADQETGPARRSAATPKQGTTAAKPTAKKATAKKATATAAKPTAKKATATAAKATTAAAKPTAKKATTVTKATTKKAAPAAPRSKQGPKPVAAPPSAESVPAPGRRGFGFRAASEAPDRPSRPSRPGRPPFERGGRPGGDRRGPGGPGVRPGQRPRPDGRTFERPGRPRPAGQRPDERRGGPERPAFERPASERPGRPPFERPGRPAFGRSDVDRRGPARGGSDRPPFERRGQVRGAPASFGPRRGAPRPAPRSGEERERSAPDRPFDRPQGRPPYADRPPGARPPGRPYADRPPGARPPAPRHAAPFGGAPGARQPVQPLPDLLVDEQELVAGRRPVEEAFVARRDAVRLLVVPQRRQALEKLVLHATALRIPIVEVEGGTLTALAGFDGHQGIALVVGPRRYASVEAILARAAERGEPPFVLVLDSLEDPQNVGTLLRSAEAAGVHGVVFPTRRQAPLTPAAVKASAGAVEHLLLAPVEDLAAALADLHVRGLRIAGAEAEAPLTVREADLRGPLAIVVGSEGQGLGPAVRRRCDLLMRIPMRGAVGSLNASVAGSILLFEAVGQRFGAGGREAPVSGTEDEGPDTAATTAATAAAPTTAAAATAAEPDTELDAAPDGADSREPAPGDAADGPELLPGERP
ncbi:MAG: hypothetical protein RL338_1769 [Chloroflexota bacterium]